MDNFPFKSSLSLNGLIDYWQSDADQKNQFKSASANLIADYVEKHPELLQPISDDEIIRKHCDFIRYMMSAVIPPAKEGNIAAAYKPFSFDVFYGTDAFWDLINLHDSIESLIRDIPITMINLQKTVSSYAAVMSKFYQTDIAVEKPILLNSVHPQTGLKKYYKVEINISFCDIELKGELPPLDSEEIKEMLANPYDIKLWSSKLPFDLFVMKGFSVYNFIDVTVEESISQIKESLLDKDSIVEKNSFGLLEEKFQSLLEIQDLSIGISGYEKNKSCFVDLHKSANSGVRSTDGMLGMTCQQSQKLVYSRFKNDPNPIIVSDIESYEVVPELREYYLNKGSKSVIIAPLFDEDNFIGLLELRSKNSDDLGAFSMNKVDPVLPLLSIALKRSSEELENRVQSVIKEKYTSIHPSVEWRFLNAAYNILEKQEKGVFASAEDIIFKDVYPLYGASDIRNSSDIRNDAIKNDLKQQLKLAKNTLKALGKAQNFPFLEELEFQVSKLVSKINKGLLSGDETNIISFLQNEVEPVFKKLGRESDVFEEIAQHYWNALDEDLDMIYEQRKNFEVSLTKLNSAMSTHIDEQQVSAQNVFPHFFEKYKTDGVEHNMYIGQSLTIDKEFHSIYVRNLRIWQLITMAEAAKLAINMMPDLPIPLETTHLILVHNSTLSVEFRMDEKLFDVDGAYNMRYEIVKKRIDKALVNGSDERITQPGKITIVYSQETDAEEYMHYIEFLRSKGLFTDTVERLEVEPLQGVVGLKAIRVTVDQTKEKIMDELEKMEIIRLPEAET